MFHEKYEAVIGLEVHAQLHTESKAFSPDAAGFGGAPNTHVDPVSLGHPGTLPVMNARLVEYTVRMGLATHCRIAPRSIMARKHYFYPDLPKGYQISQYEAPLCEGGYVDVFLPGPDGGAITRRIGLTRIHMEEDAGKLVHDQDPYHSLVDINRCGVPLMEIVSEPDLRTAQEAQAYMQRIRQIVRYLGICDGNMEEGSLRCDANVSIRPRGSSALGAKAEIKNMNSFRHVERAVEYEIARQIRLVEEGGAVAQETRLWDPLRLETRSMRSKEEAHDYRYFPDPDLPPVVVEAAWLDEVAASLPALPEARRDRLCGALGLPAYDAGVITEDRAVADYFEATLTGLERLLPEHDRAAAAKAVSNAVMSDVLRALNEGRASMDAFPVEPDRLAGLLRLRLRGAIGSSGATQLFEAMLSRPEPPEALAEALNLLQVSDGDAIGAVAEAVVAAHPKQVGQYLGGKESVIGFFIGQVMKQFPGSPDPAQVRAALATRLEARRNQDA